MGRPPLTEDDLAAMDGVLLVSPAPALNHRRCVVALTVLLASARDPEHELLVAPFDLRTWSTPRSPATSRSRRRCRSTDRSGVTPQRQSTVG